MTTYAERFNAASVRIDRLIWIPASIIGGNASEYLSQAIEDMIDNNEQVLGKLPHLAPIFELGRDEPDGEELAEYLWPVTGFFAQLARPIPTSFNKSGSYSYSWGMYQTTWVYVEKLSELPDIADQFSERVVSDAKADANAA